MRIKNRKPCCSVIAMLFLSNSAFAADDTTQKRSSIEEIVVTATYRETSLMDTAQSISALDAELIKEIGAQDMSGIFRFIPGLNMTGEDTGNTRYAIRGITS